MSRLIDADSITEKIMNVFEEALRIALKSGTFDLEGVMLKIKCYLDNQPTAFDVDKVISNIWDRSELIHIKHNCYDEVEDYIRVTDVTQIVREGGLDETKIL